MLDGKCCCALQWWHMWGHTGESLQGVFSARGDEELQTLRGCLYSGTTAQECRVCAPACVLAPSLLLLPAATVFLQCWTGHTLLTDRGASSSVVLCPRRSLKALMLPLAAS